MRLSVRRLESGGWRWRLEVRMPAATFGRVCFPVRARPTRWVGAKPDGQRDAERRIREQYLQTPASRPEAVPPAKKRAPEGALSSVGAREQTRTATACGHHPLKMACLPISPRGQRGNSSVSQSADAVNDRFRGDYFFAGAGTGTGAGAAGLGSAGAGAVGTTTVLSVVFSSTERFCRMMRTSMNSVVPRKPAASQ